MSGASQRWRCAIPSLRKETESVSSGLTSAWSLWSLSRSIISKEKIAAALVQQEQSNIASAGLPQSANINLEQEATLLGGLKMEKNVPIWQKSNLTLEEAAMYTGVGINRLRELSNEKECPFVLWVGNKRLLKRRKLDEYLDNSYSI